MGQEALVWDSFCCNISLLKRTFSETSKSIQLKFLENVYNANELQESLGTPNSKLKFVSITKIGWWYYTARNRWLKQNFFPHLRYPSLSNATTHLGILGRAFSEALQKRGLTVTLRKTARLNLQYVLYNISNKPIWCIIFITNSYFIFDNTYSRGRNTEFWGQKQVAWEINLIRRSYVRQLMRIPRKMHLAKSVSVKRTHSSDRYPLVKR